MRDVDFDECGRLREVTSIEFCPLGNGTCQWILWSDDVRLETHTCHAVELDVFFNRTRFFLEDHGDQDW